MSIEVDTMTVRSVVPMGLKSLVSDQVWGGAKSCPGKLKVRALSVVFCTCLADAAV